MRRFISALGREPRPLCGGVPLSMRVLMTCHADSDINSGVYGCTVNLGRELEASGVSVNYYTYSDLPQNLDFRIKHCIFPFFVFMVK